MAAEAGSEADDFVRGTADEEQVPVSGSGHSGGRGQVGVGPGRAEQRSLRAVCEDAIDPSKNNERAVGLDL